MNTYTIKTTGGPVQFTLCAAHAQSGLDASEHVDANGMAVVKVRPATRDELCEVCRQDRIRDAIRSLGSVVA